MKHIKEAINEYVETGGDAEIIAGCTREYKAILKLMKYAQHKPGCNSFMRERDSGGRFARYACNCGLDKIMRELKAGQE